MGIYILVRPDLCNAVSKPYRYYSDKRLRILNLVSSTNYNTFIGLDILHMFDVATPFHVYFEDRLW